MKQPSTHPFDGLTPDTILDALESQNYHVDGRVTALNSYENRVYQVGIESVTATHTTVTAHTTRIVAPSRRLTSRVFIIGLRDLTNKYQNDLLTHYSKLLTYMRNSTKFG